MHPENRNRRQFVQQALATSVGFAGLGLMLERRLEAGWLHDKSIPGYGPLIPDPNSIIDLPAGFEYQVLSKAGEQMNDGFLVPGKHDGMAAFPGPDGMTILIRNHEISPGHRCIGPFDGSNDAIARVDPSLIYDIGSTVDGNPSPSRGGCTRLLYDTRQGKEAGKLIHQELALVGTEHNCAGGPTPHSTWLSCEESIVGPAPEKPWTKPHGYVFEVPTKIGSGLVKPQPIIAMGRMNHEAVAVDPQTGIVYMTEDRNDGCLYRFLPKVRGRYLEGGSLQALAISGLSGNDLRNWESPQPFAVGTSRQVQWIPVEDVDSSNDSLRSQAAGKGAAIFARGEGMWMGDGELYFACTTGGANQRGQIWRYRPADPLVEGTPMENIAPRGQLTLLAEPNDAAVVEHADNLTVSPWGDLIVCEDGSEDQFLLGVTPKGSFYKFGRNAMNRSEFAGATFSPDASTLFVNIQNPGLTLAIRGPWRS
ncbi:MAG: phosphatase [Phycisphaerae bacterium]|nr:phosphatase [Phycisphaerae bacterium]|tara:strand:- start:1445 stop:2878 length:1434 start_codon:yes stop_codon:yes gene_type:complete